MGALRIDIRRLLSRIECKVRHLCTLRILKLPLSPLPSASVSRASSAVNKKISYGESQIPSQIKKNQKMGNRDTKVIRRVSSPLFTTNQAIENGKRFYFVVHRAERFRQDNYHQNSRTRIEGKRLQSGNIGWRCRSHQLIKRFGI